MPTATRALAPRALRVTVTGASGLIGGALVTELAARGAEVTVLSRDPERALHALMARVQEREGVAGAGPAGRHAPPPEPRALPWEPVREPAPADALAGRDAVVHLAGESIDQRWRRAARRAIAESRELGTRNLAAGLREAARRAPGARAPTLVSASAIGYYGDRGEEPLDESAPVGSGFLAQVCAAWEAAAESAREHVSRLAILRIGVVLDPRGGALGTMLPPFRAGLGGPVAGGRQYVSWIHPGDLVALVLRAIEDARLSGPLNATAPEPVTNAELARTLGRVLHRPAVLPIPGLALRARYGAMASLVTSGARVLPAKALIAGFRFGHPQLEQALRDVLA
jgi:uncharacterized protein (TIGR01777 family)